MSLPLKPLTSDTDVKQLDSKQKKFHYNVVRALEHFDLVTEWADYIASLGKLLKALQSWNPQFKNVKYFVPSPYQVSRRLTSSLASNLPAGVHQKTIEVYTFIFSKIGLETLANECNIWVPGILSLMTYASMSVKGPLIELYDNYLVQLPPSTLKLLIRPLLASLLPGIDDESSEFQPLTMGLIETLKTRLGDDSLFWQTCFIIMMKNSGRRLGGLVWLTKKFPSLNAVPHLQSALNANQEELSKLSPKEKAFKVLLPESKAVVTPDVGLLIRAMVSSLDEDNDLLIKRGILDLLSQRLHLDSPVLSQLATEEDRQLLIMSVLKTSLSKDMSLNRRVWNWLLGTSTTAGRIIPNKEREKKGDTEVESSGNTSEFFNLHALKLALQGLKSLANKEEDIAVAFNICLAIMDRWEIGSTIIPEMFIPLILGAQHFQENKQIMKIASSFFDAVETNIIWGKVFQWFLSTKDFKFLEFILSNFNISNEEEIVVRHLPLILLALLSLSDKSDEYFKSTINRYTVCKQLLEFIPERAYLPLAHSNLKFTEVYESNENLMKIVDYYASVSDLSRIEDTDKPSNIESPFTSENLTFLTVKAIYDILIINLSKESRVFEASNILILLMDKIPISPNNDKESVDDVSHERLVNSLLTSLHNDNLHSDSVFGIVLVFSNFLSSRIDLLLSLKLLKQIMLMLWPYIVGPNKQLSAIKALESLTRNMNAQYVESALSHAFVAEQNISKQLSAIELLWSHFDSDSKIIERPLQLILDELSDTQSPNYLYISKWIMTLKQNNTLNKLFDILLQQILEFDFWKAGRIMEFNDMDSFTYRIQSLQQVLNTNENQIVEEFSSEPTISPTLDIWNNEDVSTFKKHTLLIILKFLSIKNNKNPKSIRSVLLLLDTLLDGTESNFKIIVISLLQLSSNYVSLGDTDSESMAVSLLNIVSKVLQLSHVKGIKLDIFDDNTTHLKYIDYLVTSIATMDTPLILTSYVKLLSESILYFKNSIFRMILPLTACMVQHLEKIFDLEKSTGGYYQCIVLLLGALDDLLKVAHTRLLSDQQEGYLATTGSRGGDFLQSMVSNVFASDNSQLLTKIQGERDVVIQSFKQVIDSCIGIYSWIHTKYDHVLGSTSDMEENTTYKLKFKTKSLLEKLYLAEPQEVLESIIHSHSDDMAVTLVRALDGNRPKLSVPYFLHGLVLRFNKASSIKFNTLSTNASSATKGARFEPSLLTKVTGYQIISFLFAYIETIENASVEEFYPEFIIYCKDVVSNPNLYSSISSSNLTIMCLVAEKLNKSSFADQKAAKREISDSFTRYLPNVLSDIRDSNEDIIKQYEHLAFIVSRIQYAANDMNFGDRYNSALSSIIGQCISPYLKSKSVTEVPTYVIDLAVHTSKYASKVKSWKVLIGEVFDDDRKFIEYGKDQKWVTLFGEWCRYPDNKAKVMSDLLLLLDSKNTSVTPSLLSFNSWNSSENETKSKSIIRMAYLIMICPEDFFILHFQSLITYVCQLLLTKELTLKSRCWVLLRAMLLKFSETHFNDYWSSIVYLLQTSLQEFYEILEAQGAIDSTYLFQTCKTLDILLIIGFEDFDATNEWLFIIDSISCLNKNNSYVALVDEISETKLISAVKGNSLVRHNNSKGEKVLPVLYGIHSTAAYTDLAFFFNNLSIDIYNTSYSLEKVDIEACREDVTEDIFVLADNSTK